MRLYTLAMASCVVIIAWIAQEWQIPWAHWAMVSGIVTMQSLRPIQSISSMLDAAFARVIGSLLGIGLGFVGMLYMNMLISDLLHDTFFVVLFVIMLASVSLAEWQPGFRLTPVATALMISLMLTSDHSEQQVMYGYLFCVCLGVLLGAVLSVITRFFTAKHHAQS